MIPGSTEADSRQLVRQLVEEMREEYTHPDQRVPNPLRRRRYWVAAVLGGLCLVCLEVVWLLNLDQSAGPFPPARLIALFKTDPCAQRQLAILHAITVYQDEHGQPPSALTLLGPPGLTVPPVDPTSGRPYVYTRNGDNVSLVCPNPDLHALSALPWRR